MTTQHALKDFVESFNVIALALLVWIDLKSLAKK